MSNDTPVHAITVTSTASLSKPTMNRRCERHGAADVADTQTKESASARRPCHERRSKKLLPAAGTASGTKRRADSHSRVATSRARQEIRRSRTGSSAQCQPRERISHGTLSESRRHERLHLPPSLHSNPVTRREPRGDRLPLRRPSSRLTSGFSQP